MKPTQELVFALRRAAMRIIDPKGGYKWISQQHCNCGMLVRELCGYSASEVKEELKETKMVGSWTAVGQSCALTGFPHSFIFDTLQSVGFEAKDFQFVEHAGFPEHKLWEQEVRFWADAQYVHDFFLKLADQLELQLTGRVESRDPVEPAPSARRLSSTAAPTPNTKET